MAKDTKTDPKNFYPRYATNNCADCNDMYYTKWGRVRATNYDLFLPENNIIAACRNEKGFYPFRDERGLGMAELGKPVDHVLESSGALSLGTTAGTNRSIATEFGGSTPHALSEYYGCFDFILCTRVCNNPTNGYSDWYTYPAQSTWSNPVCKKVWFASYIETAQCINWIEFCIKGCSLNKNGSGIGSGTHKFSDFHGDTSTDIRNVCILVISCEAVSIWNYNGGYVTLSNNYQVSSNTTSTGGFFWRWCVQTDNYYTPANVETMVTWLDGGGTRLCAIHFWCCWGWWI